MTINLSGLQIYGGIFSSRLEWWSNWSLFWEHPDFPSSMHDDTDVKNAPKTYSKMIQQILHLVN